MAASSRYAKLLEPGYIGKVKTRNRIYKTGASMMSWNEDELHMNPTTLGFYEAVARGGVGLLVVESPTIDYPRGARWKYRYRLDDDKYIEGMKGLVDVIHKHGCPTFMQMEHDGPWQSPVFDNTPPTFEGPPIGASAVKIDSPADFHHDLIRPMTIPEIKELTEKCIKAAARAQKAGFDGVDINAGSSHIFHNFLSPFWNKRTDEYGGSQENRSRLLVDIIKGIKQACGKDFPITVCINGFEVGRPIGVDDKECLTHELALQSMSMAVEAGADALMVRSHWLGLHVPGFLPDYMFYPEAQVPVDKMPPQYYSKEKGVAATSLMVAEAKKLFPVPVILIGYVSPEKGEQILKAGRADFIGMHRALMSDPELPNKLVAGRREEVALCTHCGTCLDQSEGFLRHCRINAAMGTPDYIIEKAKKPKKVVVVGGGPGGMEAARVAARRGHQVTLYDRSPKLGGLLDLAALIKGVELEDLPGLAAYFKTQLRKLGVRLELGREVSASFIEELKPDVVVVAAGGTLTVPDVKGIDSRRVVTVPGLHRRVKPFLGFFGPKVLGWLTKLWLPIGKRVVVIGSGLHGCETAEFLVKRGRKVTIVDTAEKPGEGMLDFRMGLFMEWYVREGGVLINGVKNMEITDKGLAFTDKEGKKQTLEADSVIPTAPLKANNTLAESLKGKVPEVYAIGDCREPRLIVDAVGEGYHTLRTV